MLYVKNLVFLDGAIARLALDLDILAEIAAISVSFARSVTGPSSARELGIGPVEVDLDGAGRRAWPRPGRRAPHPPRGGHAAPLIQQRMREDPRLTPSEC